MLALAYDNTAQRTDLERDGGNYLQGVDLEMAITVSLFSDAERTPEDDPGPSRGGWWADVFADDAIGSRIWLLLRTAATTEAAALIATEAERCMAWLVTDLVADSVSASAVWVGSALKLSVEIVKPGNAGVWAKTWELTANAIQ